MLVLGRQVLVLGSSYALGSRLGGRAIAVVIGALASAWKYSAKLRREQCTCTCTCQLAPSAQPENQKLGSQNQNQNTQEGKKANPSLARNELRTSTGCTVCFYASPQ